MASLKKEFETEDVRKPSERRAGLALPISRNGLGRLSLISGSENDFKIISLAVMSNSNTNAFQQPSVDIDEAIFEMDDIMFRALVRRKLEAIFRDFDRQHRYRLIQGSMNFVFDGSGSVNISFSYHNIEADKPENIQVELNTTT